MEWASRPFRAVHIPAGEFVSACAAIPSINLSAVVAVTGSLGRGEAKPDSDADLFIVTEPKRLYTARAFVLLILKFTGQRINVEAGRVAGAVDPNYWLSGDNLDLKPHNAYVARDYSYMLPLWDACDIYFKLVDANSWLAEWSGA